MGILDHTRTWYFEAGATPGDCVRAFADALGGRSGTLTGSPWRVAIAVDGDTWTAVGTYRTVTAFGSQMTFTAKAGHDGTTACTIAMTRTVKIMHIFTADAPIFRETMQRVASRLRTHSAGHDLLKV